MIFCFSYSKLNVQVLSAIISLIICIIVYYKFDYSKISLIMNLEKTNSISVKELSEIEKMQNLSYLQDRTKIKDIAEHNEKNDTLKKLNESTWKLEIPKIELIANIAEGTSEEVLDIYIGHFEDTQKTDGNIGLAAHNRGYKVNFFNRLKELEVGDKIIYTCFGESRIYQVSNKFIIEDTNWEVLKNTGENKLTLITCVENKPTKRLCVQAIEIKEEKE